MSSIEYEDSDGAGSGDSYATSDDNSNDSSEPASKRSKSEDSSFKKKIYRLLKKVKTSTMGDFAISGELPQAPLIRILAKNSDSGKEFKMHFPMDEEEATNLLQCFEQSPYGLGEKTVVDTNVRNSWQLNPDGFTILNSNWQGFIEKTLVPHIAKEMAIQSPFTASLYKLLLYKTGSMFKLHRDSEKEGRMFGTLIVQLPSKYQGGELVVHHENKTKKIDFSSTAKKEAEYSTWFAVFYCDCQHEVLPVIEGTRICLVYNLALTDSQAVAIPLAPRTSNIELALAEILKPWKSAKGFPCPSKLVYALAHKYSMTSLSFKNLKSTDKSIGVLLKRVCEEHSLPLALAIIEKHSHGNATGSGSDDLYSDDPDSCCERNYYLSHLSFVTSEESSQNAGLIKVRNVSIDFEDEVIPENCFEDETPFNKEKEKTGNAGVQVSLSYRIAAFVLWPHGHAIDVLLSLGEENSVADLFLVEWSKSREAAVRDENLNTNLLRWAKAIAKARGSQNSQSHVALLSAFAELNNLDLLKLAFLHRFSHIETSTLPLIVSQCDKLGWSSFAREIVAMFKTITDRKEALQLLNFTIGAGNPMEAAKKSVCQSVAKEVLEMKTPEPNHWGRAATKTADEKRKEAEDNIDFFYSFCTIAKRIHFSPMEYFRKQSISTVVAVIIKLASDTQGVLEGSWAELAQYVSMKIEEQLRNPTKAPNYQRIDFRSCGCAECRSMLSFMLDKEKREQGFKLNKARRYHLHQLLNGMTNISHVTQRHTVPETLVVTKTGTPSYEPPITQEEANAFLPKLKEILTKSLPTNM